MTARYRQGHKVPRHVYDGDTPLFTARTDDEAKELVALLNVGVAAVALVDNNPDLLRKWRSMSEHQFPWEPSRLAVACFALDDPTEIEIFICTCSNGQYFPEGDMLTCEEQGWRTYAWAEAPPEHGETSGFPGAPCPLVAYKSESKEKAIG